MSNHSPARIDLLQASVDQPLRFNQIEYSPLRTVLLDAAIHANMRRPQYGNPGEGIIEYCRLHDMCEPFSIRGRRVTVLDLW